MIREVVSAQLEAMGAAVPTIATLLQAADAAGMNKTELEGDLADLITERLFFHLIGPVRPELTRRERSSMVRRRLLALGLDEDMADAMVAPIVLAQGAIDQARGARRESIDSLEETRLAELLRTQSYRCRTCRVPLRDRVRQRTLLPQFNTSGLEPVFIPTLDHVLPFYLVGNETPYVLLCRPCNSVKKDRLGRQEDGFVVAGNTARTHEDSAIQRRVAFWRLNASPECSVCGSSGSVLLLARRDRHERFVAENLRTVCAVCATAQDYWLHAST